MHASHQTDPGFQVYAAHSGESLLSEVAYSVCVLFPRELVTAGFHEKGHALMVRCTELPADQQEWNADFFEHAFINDPLLAGPQPVQAVFIASGAFLLTPTALFEPAVAETWLQQLYFREHNEVTEHFNPEHTATTVSYHLPRRIRELARQYFAEAALIPLAAMHLAAPFVPGYLMQCTVAPAHALASLHYNGKLVWCQQFAYSNAEEIAYQLKTALREYKCEGKSVPFHGYAAGAATPLAILRELSAYFPEMQTTNGHLITHDSQWLPVLYFLSQLRTCVS